jgi:hypothetical protein
MAKQRRRTLTLERLEDRWVPSSIQYDGSNLTITNLTGSSPAVGGIGGGPTLAVTQQSNGTFVVKVNSAVIENPLPGGGKAGGPFYLDTTTGVGNGNFFVTGNLNINAGGGNVVIQVTLDNASANSGLLPGNLTINTGNGNDTVILTTISSLTDAKSTGGTIGGSLSVNFGSGADFFEYEPDKALSGGAAATDKLFIGGSVNISGVAGSGTLAAVVAKGMEGFAAHNWAEFNQISTIVAGQTVTATIGGNVNVRGISETNIDAFNEPGPTMLIGGNVTVQESTATPPAFANPDATGDYTTMVPALPDPLNNYYVAMSVSTRIGGSVSISGTSGSTYVLADSSIGGSLSVNLASSNGNNTLDLNLNVPAGIPGNPMTIGQNVNFTAGNGNNTLLFDDSLNAAPNGPNPLLIGGSVNVNFGNGNNSYEQVNNSIAGGDVLISGNLNITAGNGTNKIATVGPFSTAAFGTPTPLTVAVNGNESFTVGNGANTVEVGTAPGGSLYFHGGNGTDNLQLANAAANGVGSTQTYNNFVALFGNGTNTFTLGTGSPPPAATDGFTVVASGEAIGGTGSNTFVQNTDAVPITVPFNLINF